MSSVPAYLRWVAEQVCRVLAQILHTLPDLLSRRHLKDDRGSVGIRVVIVYLQMAEIYAIICQGIMA